MTPEEARSVLGLRRSATSEEIRAAFRRLVRRHHPDVAGPGARAHHETARLTEAYGVLLGGPPQPIAQPARDNPPPAVPRPPAGVPPDPAPLPDPSRSVLLLVREAADLIGDVSYLDRDNGVLEAIVRREGWPPASLLISIRQHGEGTLAHCTLETLDGSPGPPITEVVADLHRALRVLGDQT
jgi:hypothetical protein